MKSFCLVPFTFPCLWILSYSKSNSSFEFSPISLMTFFSKERFRSSHVSFLLTGIPDTIIQFRREYWCNWSSSTDCLSSSSDSLSLVFWLTRSVDSRASTLFSKDPTFFSNVVTFDYNDSTIAFNSVTSLVLLLSFLGVSDLLLVLLPLVILLIFWYFSLLLFWFVCCFSSSYIFISDFE